MSAIQKSIEKFYRIPVPNAITFDELVLIARHFGFEVVKGGKHGFTLWHTVTHRKIPIPRHGDTVQEAYIRQVKIAIEEAKNWKK